MIIVVVVVVVVVVFVVVVLLPINIFILGSRPKSNSPMSC